MKKSFAKIIILMIISAFLLDGCAQVYSMSEETEDKIALYSANLIGRFNVNQKRGIVPVIMAEKPVYEEEMQEENSSTEADFPLNPYDVNAPTSDGGVSSLGEILGIPGVSFSYIGAEPKQDYGENEGFLISPMKGNSFVAVNFRVNNTGDEAVTCDIRSRGVNYMATIGEVSSAVERSLLSTALPTYAGTIAAGEHIDLTLLFQFPTEYVSDLSGLIVFGVKEGVKYEITL